MTKFKIVAKDGKARVGKLITSRGVVNTPMFLPVGTQATVKALDFDDLHNLSCEMILANTYHLYLRPGADKISQLGGLHKFMNWDRPILTDSGGFQVFSLGFGIEHGVGKLVDIYGDSNMVIGETINTDKRKEVVVRTKLCKIEEDGPTFQSHIDGSVHFFPPEKSVETQMKLGADFMIALDECTSPLHDYDYTKASMERSHRWEKRSLDYLDSHSGKRSESRISENTILRDPGQARMTEGSEMFGVVQGGPFEDLRVESAKFVTKNDFFGVGIGGALVSHAKMMEIMDWIHPHLEPQKPRHLLGIGMVDDIFEAVGKGVDIFDCVYPTRIARSALILSKPNKIIANHYNSKRFFYDLGHAYFNQDSLPLEAGCTCFTCQNHSKAYVHHLFRTHELLAYRLATIHNIHFMLGLMKEIREAIVEKQFDKLKREWLQ